MHQTINLKYICLVAPLWRPDLGCREAGKRSWVGVNDGSEYVAFSSFLMTVTEELVRRRAEHNEGEICSLEELALHQQDIEKYLFVLFFLLELSF